MDQNKHINWDNLLAGLEKDRLEGKQLTPEEQELLTELLALKNEASDLLEDYRYYDTRKRWEELKQHIEADQAKAKGVRLWPRVAVAAAILLVLGAGLFYIAGPGYDMKMVSAGTADSTKVKQSATLTLANGRKIKLSDVTTGELAKEAGIVITKAANGQLTYELKNSGPADNKINTLSTARGETYVVTLSDKSKVWLNAASSLTYSASLNDEGKRLVKLKGEAYFEVTKDKAHPFVVRTGDQETEVLGTSFNINAYSEKIRTTLAEGKVNVTIAGSGKQLILNPGQQADFDLLTGKLEKREVDVFPFTAWKDGLIVYQNVKLAGLMAELGRLYDYDVVFKDENLKQLHFTGRADRSEAIQSVLDGIQRTSDLKFTIKERSIIVEKLTRR